MCIQLLHEQVELQDVTDYQTVAHITGCVQVSDPGSNIVSFVGNVASILAAFSFMVTF